MPGREIDYHEATAIVLSMAKHVLKTLDFKEYQREFNAVKDVQRLLDKTSNISLILAMRD